MAARSLPPTPTLPRYTRKIRRRDAPDAQPLPPPPIHQPPPLNPRPDTSLDGTLIPLLRNQQTTDVLRAESASVRRLNSALKLPEDPPPQTVLDAVSDVVAAHDARAERAQRAVAMLREKFDWRVRVAVDPDEVWSDNEDVDGPDIGEAAKRPGSPASANTSEEEEELENVLGSGIPNSDHEHEDVQMAEG